VPGQAYAWVLDQVRRTRSSNGRTVTVEGGVHDPGVIARIPVTAYRVGRFVDATVAGGAVGASHYDYATTPVAFWSILARLNEREACGARAWAPARTSVWPSRTPEVPVLVVPLDAGG
jgi:hypothetical protein